MTNLVKLENLEKEWSIWVSVQNGICRLHALHSECNKVIVMGDGTTLYSINQFTGEHVCPTSEGETLSNEFSI